MEPQSAAPQTALETLLALSDQLGRAETRSQILNGSLEVLCRHFDSTTGWITLRTPDGEQEVVAHRGLPPAFAANDLSALRWTPCRCQSMHLRGALPEPCVVACDRLELASGDNAGLRHHATAILRSGERDLGMLHVALSSERKLTIEQTAVLAAAGRTIGFALQRLASPQVNGRDATEQGAMLALTSTLLSLLDAPQIASETVRILLEPVGAPVLGVLSYEPSTSQLVLRASSGLGVGATEMCISLGDLDDPLVAATRATVPYVLRGDQLPLPLRNQGMRSLAAAPMTVAGKLMGLLIAGDRDPDRFRAPDLRFLALAADQVALAFDRTDMLTRTRRQVRDLASLHQRTAEQTRQLSETYGATLAVLGDALELRDEDTMGHTERVVSLAVSLGRLLGLPSEELMHLEWGAYVHDLGKIGVPDAVLRKPGPLSPEEWRLMQRHPEQGYALLQRLLFLSRSLDVVRFHHERFDGKGYPIGLGGNEIPLLARIFAVADAYDAMTNDRPYRRAMTGDEALTEIRRNRGSQFDPAVVDALLELPDAERSPMRRVPQSISREAQQDAAPLAGGGETLLQFAEMAGAVLRASDLPNALETVVAEIEHRFGYPSCAVLLAETEGQSMQLAAQRGFQAGQGLFGDPGIVVAQAVDAATPIYARDIGTPPAHHHVRSELALPLTLDGVVLGVLDVGSPEPDAFPDPVRSVLEAFAMLVSFTIERSRRDAELQRLALTDQVTGLGNQRALMDAAERELARSARHGTSVSILSLHLDQFADLHRQSRQHSEAALRTVARLLHQACRKEDVAGRRDGGEYVVVLPETAKVGALLVAERIRADLARLTNALGGLSISVGVASLPDDGQELPHLLEAADQAMYRALRRGGNEVVAATRRAPN